jgi:ABC-type Zn uptake system ZnuABC Zn-binding protein ZnuA
MSVLVGVCLGLSLAVGWATAGAQEATPEPAGTPAGAGLVLAPLPDAAPPTGKPLVVVASTPLLADLAAQVGGSRVETHAILPADADPHEYEPVPADLVTVEQAQLIVEFGLNLDQWAVEIVENAGAKAPVVVATTGVPTIASDEPGFGGGDPHVWFDPTNVQIMVSNIAAALSTADPAGALSFAARRDAYNQQLAGLDTWIAGQIATIPPERRKLVTNHDAFGYYVRRYGLTFVGSVIPSIDTNTEPSAQQTAELIDKIKAEGVPAIFTEASVNPELEEQLAKEAGVKVVDNLYGDNLGQPGSGADTYIGMMVTDTNLIVGALR